MSGDSRERRDFFVSFNQADRAWATWISWVLEAAGYTVFFQDWDFRGSFVEQMHQATRRAKRTLVVLSDNYLRSEYARSEAWTALADDPVGREDRVIVVKIGPANDLGLLGHFAYLDLSAVAGPEAERLLLERAKRSMDPAYRSRPESVPAFPGVLAGQTAANGRAQRPNHNLPPPNPHFVGREEVLAQLQELLGQDQGPAVLTLAITGLGGIGKTQTVLAYCYRHLAEYTLIWWLEADQGATLATQFVSLAPHLGLDPTTPDQDALVQAVRARLADVGGFLLVFDNLEDPDLLPNYLPRTGGKVVVTARRQNWQGRARTLPLDVMPAKEAIRLLTGANELAMPLRKQANLLAEELGYLPLALAQARSYMVMTGETLAGYRSLLAESRPAVLAEARAHPEYPATVARTWEVSICGARKEFSAAPELLELLAFFAPDPLPRTVLDADPEALPEELRGRLAGNRAIAALTRFSLVAAAEGTVVVHRLVQAVTRDGLDEATARARAAAVVRLLSAALPRPADDHTNWPAIGALLPHMLAAAEAAERLEADLVTAATLLNNAAIYHQARGAWVEALPLLERAVVLTEKALGPKHFLFATALSNLAELYLVTGRYEEAELHLTRALAISEATLGPEEPVLAVWLNNLAEFYRVTGRYRKAEPLYKRALAIGGKGLGPEEPVLAVWLNNLALLYQATGRLAEAEPILTRALAISEKAFGPEHPIVATRLNNLALLYQATGRLAEAELMYEHAIAIGEKALGPEHPDVATRLHNLGGLYQDTGRYAEAEQVYQRALAITEKAFSQEHPNFISRLDNLAGFYLTTKRYADAEPLLMRVITILRESIGPEHPSYAGALSNLAHLYQDTERLTEAEPLLQRALAISEKVHGPDHPEVAVALSNLGLLYKNTDRLAKATPHFERAVAILEKNSPARDWELVIALENYAVLADQLGKRDAAAALRAQAAAIRLRHGQAAAAPATTPG
jgi:tetratricopeptide (TPR) repeat protein